MVGILALQGAYAAHGEQLTTLGIPWCEVRTPEDLARCSSLIIPGGESTVMTKLLTTGQGAKSGFYDKLRAFVLDESHQVMGTCAGLIMLARPCGDERVTSLDVLPVSVARNAYGRQTESFIEELELKLPISRDSGRAHAEITPVFVEAVFIRAPRITGIGGQTNTADIHIIAERFNSSGEKEAVAVCYKNISAFTFHPELSGSGVHRWFCERAGELTTAL